MTREEAKTILGDYEYILFEDEDTYNREAFKMAIKALENHDEFMKRSYEQGKADALSQELCITRDIEKSNFSQEQYLLDTDSAYKIGYEQAKSEAQKSGKWIETDIEHEKIATKGTYTTTIWNCSECGAEPLAEGASDLADYALSNYCPNCGARMESEEKE